MIREASFDDLNGLLELYLHLHEICIPEDNENLRITWNKILNNEDYHIVVCEEEGVIVSSCTCVIVPNLTRSASPYALIENVVTHNEHRCNGYAAACLEYAAEIALKNGCYKMMLITGSDNSKTHSFYKKCGYNSEGKTAYYKMLKEVNWNKL